MKILKKNQKSKENYLRESCITNRVMLVFVTVAVALWGFSRLVSGMNYVSSYWTARTAAWVVLGVFVAGLAASLLWAWKNRGKANAEYKVLTPELLAGFCAAGVLGAWLILRNFAVAMQMLYVLLPVLAVLYLVYYTFQREFFLLCAASTLSMLAIWSCGSGGLKKILLVLAALALDGLLFYANLKCENGTFRGIAVREAKGCAKLPMVAYPVLIALVLAAMILGNPVSVYLLYASAALLFCAAVYFTVKLL